MAKLDNDAKEMLDLLKMEINSLRERWGNDAIVSDPYVDGNCNSIYRYTISIDPAYGSSTRVITGEVDLVDCEVRYRQIDRDGLVFSWSNWEVWEPFNEEDEDK